MDRNRMDNGLTCSVITVNFNRKQGLSRTLASVERQTARDIECLVVDGGSTDGSVELLRQTTLRHHFSFISEADDGVYDAMNKGIERASGDLIVFMNAGDCFADESVIERVLDRRHSTDWDWGYGCARVMDPEGNPRSVTAFIPFRQDRLALGLAVVPHQAVFMARQLLHELGGFDLAVGISADQELLLRASRKSSPKLWADFFVDFEGGGMGSHRGALDYAREMRGARRRNNFPVYGSWAKDSVMTGLTYGLRGILEFQGRFRDRMGFRSLRLGRSDSQQGGEAS